MKPLQVLEIPPGSTMEDVKRSYRRLSVKYHPDKNPGNLEAQEKFLQVVEAYEAIKIDPSILERIVKRPSSASFIHTELEITLEDIYFARSKTLVIERDGPCSSCNGTGSKNGHSGFCSVCSGTGKIKSNVLSLMKRSPVCPSCKGSGVQPDAFCPVCSSTGLIKETSRLEITLDLKEYYNGTIILRNQGNYNSGERRGDVHIRLKIKNQSRFKVDGGGFSTFVKVSPVQHLIGDTQEIEVFGRKFKYKIIPGEEETVILDKLSDINKTRKIYIRYLVEPVPLTNEMRTLYKQILKLEKEKKNEPS